jgi:hypothetical protein
MIVIEESVKRTPQEVNLVEEFFTNKAKFSKYNFRRNNCSNVVKKFLGILGADSPRLTPWADTVRHLGEVKSNPWELQVGDVVAMGRPGDTHHVGVYMGHGKVLHQSGMRGYTVGVYEDLRAFINHRAGFYFVRVQYPTPASPDLIAQEVLSAPVVGD